MSEASIATPFGVALQRLAEADPMRPAVTCGEQTISRAELLAGAHRLAGRFAELGVAHGSLVTIGLPNSIEFIEAMFAACSLCGFFANSDSFHALSPRAAGRIAPSRSPTG